MPTPIFLLSLPRSGSTLVQRILCADPAICSVAEPWIALPFLYASRKKGCFAEYGHKACATAITQLFDDLPEGHKDYHAAVRMAIEHIYSKLSGDQCRYFLDKTPRYHLIAEQLFSVFPEGKFIFLWRNPLAVAASIINTWGKGRWNLFMFQVDLFQGLRALVEAYERHDNCLALKYEDLVSEPEVYFPKIFQFLDLEYSPAVLQSFQDVHLKGSAGRGDPIGQHLYDKVSVEPLLKWRQEMNNALRKQWCRNYLKWIGTHRLEIMGYNFDTLLVQADSLHSFNDKIPSDLFRMAYGKLFCWLELGILKEKIISRKHGICHF